MSRIPRPIRIPRTRRLLALAAFAALAAGAARPAAAQFNGQAPTNTPELNRPVTLTSDRGVLFPPAHDAILGPGDVLSVRLFGQPEYTPIVRIANDGTGQFPLIGVVPLAGITLSAAERLIQDKLRTGGFYVDPQINIQLTEGPNSSVTVVGETHGVIPIVGSRRLLDVLTQAGGLGVTASHVITIDRPGLDKPIVVDLGSDPMQSELANIPIFGGDTIIVSRVGQIFLLGAFRNPTAINLNTYTPLTLMQAMALVGGSTFEANLKDVHLIRTVGNSRTVVAVDMAAVLKGRAPDPILQPNDILYLPSSTIKVAIQQGGIGALFGAVSLALSVFVYTRQ